MASIPVLHQAATENHRLWQAVCVCERVAAFVLLILVLPAIFSSSLLIWILSRRTPLIAHRRIGRNGGTLWMLKLRTMWGAGARRAASPDRAKAIEYIADERGPELKGDADPRVPGRFARFLRRHSIDELPQLWHVLRGEMSLVGPRPVTERELERYYGIHAEEVLQVRPGLAGLWQISGRNHLSYAERCALDVQYVRERTVGMYVNILLRAIPEVIKGKNSW